MGVNSSTSVMMGESWQGTLIACHEPPTLERFKVLWYPLDIVSKKRKHLIKTFLFVSVLRKTGGLQGCWMLLGHAALLRKLLALAPSLLSLGTRIDNAFRKPFSAS